MCFLDGVPTALSNPSKPNGESLAQCLGFCPMTLRRSRRTCFLHGVPTVLSNPFKTQQQVIGTMFGFLSRNVTKLHTINHALEAG